MIFILKSKQSIFFTTVLFVSFFLSLYFRYEQFGIPMLLVLVSVFISFLGIKNSRLADAGYICFGVYLLTVFFFLPEKLTLSYTGALALSSLVFFLYLNYNLSSNYIYFYIGILLFFANLLYFPSISFTLVLLIASLVNFRSYSLGFFQFLFGYILTWLTFYQVTYLYEGDFMILDTYHEWFSFHYFIFQDKDYYLIPFFGLIIFSFFYVYKKVFRWSVLKKVEANKLFLLFIFGIFSLFFSQDSNFEYFPFIAYPTGIMIGNLIVDIKKWYHRELIFALILISILFFYFKV
ncbi:MAG: hypothetical protein H6604_04340 [Flavobacteriales bacterium]|nr:hypothetical protein [Flavobacteriales bacterium]